MDSPVDGFAAGYKPLSAVDSISPALGQTKRQLFAPFRMQRWRRLAVVCLVLGDFAGGGGGGPANGINYSPTSGGHGSSPFGHEVWSYILPWLPLIIAGAALLVALVVLWIYFASVYRFVLFDSVLYDRCELKGSWRRWEPLGRSYFFWSISLAAVIWVADALIVGAPIALAWHAGIFHHPGEHLPALILGGGALLLFIITFSICGAVVGLLARDFCIPIMAMENVGVLDAWRRLRPLLESQKSAYVLYILMKIVLAMASAIIFGIITIVVMVFLLVVLVIAGLIVFLIGKAAGLGFDIATISVLAVLGGVILTGIFYLLALISTPAMVFFQSYTIHFFGSRYPALGEVLFAPRPENPPPDLGAGPVAEPSIG